MTTEIGFNAGKVWKALAVRERTSLKQLREATRLSQNDVLFALGWLARESKVNIEKKGASYVLSLEEARVP